MIIIFAKMDIPFTSIPADACIGRKLDNLKVAVYAQAAYLGFVPNLPFTEYDFIQMSNGINRLAPSHWKRGSQPKFAFKYRKQSLLPKKVWARRY